ncbi:hypothetical protein OG455_26745 [Kitasatospora sp. NBC_01287]|uniref:hypothetical protein n=1 Tax=Kitasatospora sp. NBC_01287 TaxID=2903573 RepID=UPI00225A2CAD|nr:hypothetical protein [Kitasatospora sp. NBC_01287]MCX4749063.1 hypothetical protein [Kitasatospora sp. NBC_01287]
MKLKELASECEHGPCPTVWAIDTDPRMAEPEDVIVQGFKVDDPDALDTMRLPDTETAVRIPLSLLKRVAREYLT